MATVKQLVLYINEPLKSEEAFKSKHKAWPCEGVLTVCVCGVFSKVPYLSTPDFIYGFRKGGGCTCLYWERLQPMSI